MPMHFSFISKRKYRLSHPLIIIVLACVISNAAAQDQVQETANAFSRYTRQSPAEKIFVHTDKSLYIAGEIIWFKAYTTDATLNKPLNISKVTYVEILDTAGKAIMQAKIGMQKGSGNGSAYLPLTINSGNYVLRAYTNWMKNFSPAFFFEKPLTIINTQKISPAVQGIKKDSFNVSFFPEGGNLVHNINAKVAFKAADAYGKGFNFRGSLLDDNDTLLHFNPLHAGIGNFSFTPQAGHVYKAVIQLPAGGSLIKELPAPYPTGYTMQVNNESGAIQVIVQTNTGNTAPVYLFIHSRHVVKYNAAATPVNGKAVFNINKQTLNSGISHLTVFNSDKKPVCERLFFKPPQQQLRISLQAEMPTYTTRKKIDISYTATGSHAGDSSNLSMAVYRVDSLQPLDETFIDQYLLLASDLAGPIENPAWYFTDTSAQTEEALDNLLLTQGWRRFKWQDVLQNNKQYFTYVPEYNGHIITGTVTSQPTGKPVMNVETYLSAPGLRTQFTTAVSDSSGKLGYEMKNFYGSGSITLQTSQARKNNYQLTINNPFSSMPATTVPQLFLLPAANPVTLQQHSLSMQVQNIYSAEKSNRFSLPVSDTSAFYLHPDATYYLDDYTRFTTMEEILREYVKLVNVRKREGIYYLDVFDLSGNKILTSNPLVLLDGVPIQDMNELLKLDPLKLRKLDVVNRRYIMGATIFDGILNWESINGDMAGYTLPPAAITLDYAALNEEREFYSPVYDMPANAGSHLPDFRNLLYWNPNITTSGSNTQHAVFYSSDLPGKYVVVLQGISASGLSGSQVTSFQVNK